MSGSGRIAVEARIAGRVQGVWFRAWTRGEALELGLTGWVRNDPDGSVRALFCGSRDAVSELLERCRQGPPLARVDAVEAVPAQAPPGLTGFRIIR